jgi:hypothetical protein
MPYLIRLYIRQCLLGLAIGIGFSAALAAFNVANIGYLVTHVEGGWLGFTLLAVFNGLVFAGVQFGITIMRMADENEEK